MEDKYSKIHIFSTDTVTGIGGPISEQTLELLYELKNRPRDKKIMILVSSIQQAQKFKQWNDMATQVAEKYWPGAYSIIINDQGFRMPNNQLLLNFLEQNGPMYVTSANLSGSKPISIDQAHNIFPQVKNVHNFGESSGKPSTLINLDKNFQIIKRD
ncbi:MULTISPECIES: Sua5/YciO/YrdC/YwlC family protein [unclassified Mycoplasma]|uniref:Sua5/YciO/YrdC/YwlC family protein n=1 Tax=unclassified Mycoplasma TaxID=2683645 RepID=UPI00211C2395|nr:MULTISPECIES: Sua5/YciO/YrdC/YwlC family protein [unclassified Mycoplasma]UUM19567.1 Sua5/YciO/YrdC/YwlC family protein [Mycoplasma sp. 1578d]UUM24486.1 Sua5/YciO/YrdC/YwlC family protein [Mycoplasma sp. 3686d]